MLQWEQDCFKFPFHCLRFLFIFPEIKIFALNLSDFRELATASAVVVVEEKVVGGCESRSENICSIFVQTNLHKGVKFLWVVEQIWKFPYSSSSCSVVGASSSLIFQFFKNCSMASPQLSSAESWVHMLCVQTNNSSSCREQWATCRGGKWETLTFPGWWNFQFCSAECLNLPCSCLSRVHRWKIAMTRVEEKKGVKVKHCEIILMHKLSGKNAFSAQ